jgi:hypothetical protein
VTIADSVLLRVHNKILSGEYPLSLLVVASLISIFLLYQFSKRPFVVPCGMLALQRLKHTRPRERHADHVSTKQTAESLRVTSAKIFDRWQGSRRVSKRLDEVSQSQGGRV